jgi:nitrous oxide reductase accessory protein NosL
MQRWAIRLLTGLAVLAAAVPQPAAGGGIEPRSPAERDTCPVCGMFVAEHPQWLAQVVFEDGSAIFFDGSRDLFRYLLAPPAPGAEPERPEMAAVFVTSYYDLEVIPAESAWFVWGSDVYGPMGPELVPHASRADAEEFQRDHGGRGILRFGEVTAELVGPSPWARRRR